MRHTRKCGNCECIATFGRRSHASPFLLWLRRHDKLDYAEPIHCHIIAFLLLIHYFMLWPQPLTLWAFTLNICSISPVTWWNRTIRGGVTAISIFDFMTLNTYLSTALGSGIIFIKFDLRHLIHAWIIAFIDADTLCHAVTLTFDPFTMKVCSTSSVMWSMSVQNLSEIE